jgi:DNA-binding transcriptional LysR family regulator
MSLALKSLRAFFNDELVFYKHGRAELTPLATLLQPRVAEILRASREVVALSRAFDPATDTRTLIVAAPDEFARLLFVKSHAILTL